MLASTGDHDSILWQNSWAVDPPPLVDEHDTDGPLIRDLIQISLVGGLDHLGRGPAVQLDSRAVHGGCVAQQPALANLRQGRTWHSHSGTWCRGTGQAPLRPPQHWGGAHSITH